MPTRARRPRAGTPKTRWRGAWRSRSCGRCPLQPELCCFSCWIVWCDECWKEGDYNKRLGLRLLPTFRQRLAIQVAEVHPIAPQRRLRLRESLPEALARDAQRILRVDLQPA